MHYKTITLALLEERPEIYELLRMNGLVLQALNQYATALKSSHEFWIQQLRARRPASDPSQLSSEALEFALQELKASLKPDMATTDPAEPLSLEAAMQFVRRYTPPE